LVNVIADGTTATATTSQTRITTRPCVAIAAASRETTLMRQAR
jgi:hypothetical protein